MTNLTHLQRLEAEGIHIIREVVAEAERPVAGGFPQQGIEGQDRGAGILGGEGQAQAGQRGMALPRRGGPPALSSS